MSDHQYLDSALKVVEYMKWAIKKFKPQGSYSNYTKEMDSRAEERGIERLGNGAFSVVYKHPSCPGLVIKVGLRSNEDTALTYLAYARANPGPHIPKVYHLCRGTGYFIAVLDELYEAEEAYFLSDLNGRWDESTSPECVALQAIKKFFRGAGSIDMHSENVMQDKDGNLVLTDPVSYKQSRELCTGIERAYGVADESEDEDD